MFYSCSLISADKCSNVGGREGAVGQVSSTASVWGLRGWLVGLGGEGLRSLMGWVTVII